MIHVGGPVCWVGDQILQRCAWCGDVLLEQTYPEGWTGGDHGVGDLVRIDEHGHHVLARWVVRREGRPWFVIGADREVPEGSCMAEVGSGPKRAP